jgi:hypothetical protein
MRRRHEHLCRASMPGRYAHLTAQRSLPETDLGMSAVPLLASRSSDGPNFSEGSNSDVAPNGAEGTAQRQATQPRPRRTFRMLTSTCWKMRELPGCVNHTAATTNDCAV